MHIEFREKPKRNEEEQPRPSKRTDEENAAKARRIADLILDSAERSKGEKGA